MYITKSFIIRINKNNKNEFIIDRYYIKEVNNSFLICILKLNELKKVLLIKVNIFYNYFLFLKYIILIIFIIIEKKFFLVFK